jgi:hypothetical protein
VNANALSAGARALAVVIIVALAAVSGLLVGNAIQGRLGASATSAQIGGMVPENAGGTRFTRPELGNFVPENQGGTPLAEHKSAIDSYADYAVRHMKGERTQKTEAETNVTPGPR